MNILMSLAELNETNFKVDAFNKQLKERQKVVSKGFLEEADFMKLLITQLKTQDPTKPMEDKEFITQMAQFTSLRQMNQLSDSIKNLVREFTFTKSLGLVNKVVYWNDDLGNQFSGVVDSIKVKGGETFLMVEGKEISPNKIVEVRERNIEVQNINKIENNSKLNNIEELNFKRL